MYMYIYIGIDIDINIDYIHTYIHIYIYTQGREGWSGLRPCGPIFRCPCISSPCAGM